MIILIQLPVRVRFNPFVPQVDLYSLFNQVNTISKVHQMSYISFYNDRTQAQNRINELLELNRILILDMALKNRFEIPAQRKPFNAAVGRADFYFRHLVAPISEPIITSGISNAPVPKSEAVVSEQRPVEPFAHVPKPSADLQERAKKAIDKLGDNLPSECSDPISMEPLIDPIEINNRVYNRDTLLNLLEEGQFKDPFTRELIKPERAKSATYMLEAMEQHLEAEAGKQPALLSSHKETDVYPLRDLLESWETLLNTSPKP